MFNVWKISKEMNSFQKHYKSHIDELNVGMSTSYPLELQDFKCLPCKTSFKCHNDHMEHMTNVHLRNSQRQGIGGELVKKTKENKDTSKIKCKNGHSSQCSWAKRGRCNYDHKGDVAPNVANDKTCINGDSCKFKAQGRCSYYHRDVGVQNKEVKAPRQAPTNQWQTVPSRWQPSRQNILPKMWQQPKMMSFPFPPPVLQAQAHKKNVLHPQWQYNQVNSSTNPPHTPQAQAWCKHGAACNLGRF